MRFALVALVLAAGAAQAADHPLFRWPLIGPIAKSADNRGVDIGAPEGGAVHAAADGEVIYAGDELKSYGSVVVLRHADGYATVYGDLSQMAVATGAQVRRGDVIARSGKAPSGRTELYFELRKDGAPLDPVGYLSPR